MSDAQTIVALIITSLGAVTFWMIKNWTRSWETKLIAHDDRLTEHNNAIKDHDVQIATITANMEHIRVTGDETRDDVKELLRNQHGARSSA